MEKIMNVADILYVKRVQNRITQVELSELVGCSTGMICAIELGKRIPSVVMIVKIAKALKIEQEELYIAAADDLKKDIAKLWNKT